MLARMLVSSQAICTQQNIACGHFSLNESKKTHERERATREHERVTREQERVTREHERATREHCHECYVQ